MKLPFPSLPKTQVRCQAAIVADLLAEAALYESLAAGAALKALDAVGDAPALLARQHLLRAETFKAAAAIAAGGAK